MKSLVDICEGFFQNVHADLIGDIQKYFSTEYQLEFIKRWKSLTASNRIQLCKEIAEKTLNRLEVGQSVIITYKNKRQYTFTKQEERIVRTWIDVSNPSKHGHKLEDGPIMSVVTILTMGSGIESVTIL